MSWPAKASPAARFPTPGGPWKRYACAGPSASAARNSRLASDCSGKLSNASINLLGDAFGVAVSVHGNDAVGEHLGQRTVRRVDGAVELPPLALDPVRRLGALKRHLGIHEHEERPVWQQLAGDDEVEVEHALEAEPAGDSLVRERRVDVAIADNVLPGCERRSDDGVDELGARGGEERRLCPGTHVDLLEQELPELFAELRSAGLARRENLAAVCTQCGGEQGCLRGLP